MVAETKFSQARLNLALSNASTSFTLGCAANCLNRGDYVLPSGQSPFLRKYLVRRIGERCGKCGWAERHSITKRVPVEIEHIDGDWQNNRPENLELLCPNCHSLTPTFRGLNKRRGRPHRLGGRANPIIVHSQSQTMPRARTSGDVCHRKVLRQALSQLELFAADVAERSNAPNL